MMNVTFQKPTFTREQAVAFLSSEIAMSILAILAFFVAAITNGARWILYLAVPAAIASVIRAVVSKRVLRGGFFSSLIGTSTLATELWDTAVTTLGYNVLIWKRIRLSLLVFFGLGIAAMFLRYYIEH